MKRARFTAAVVVLLWCCAIGTAASGAQAAPLFGTREVGNPNIGRFPKWTDVLARIQRMDAAENCSGGGFGACPFAEWQAKIAAVRGLAPMEQLAAVNSFANRWTYVTDRVNYNLDDYWATPRQFLYRNGDCEDYAIIKWATLSALGFDPNSMRIVVVKDQNLGVDHAILAVYMGPKIFILDNQVRQVVDSTSIRHYKPIFSVNEAGWWMHF
ncbi:transglutaminase-like cysteine peptidase [Zavarzinia sp. CC-PAN008]|uniref:transglutaminase-like cysteine peptidase n=1 Tax=Zavarzinia sp. CC-PAN008 TaxID=3243332 RepID=UPI003F74869F